MKQIIVPTDFSPCAANALKHACLIARAAEATIVLVHAADFLSNRYQSRKELISDYNQQLASRLRQQLAAIRMETEATEKVTMVTRLYEGTVGDTVLQAALDAGADLIVMGTHGEGTLSNKLLGSVTAGLVGKSGFPLLAVPEQCPPTSPTGLYLAVAERPDARTVDFLSRLSTVFGCPLHLVVYQPDGEEPAEMVQTAVRLPGFAQLFRKGAESPMVDTRIVEGPSLLQSLQRQLPPDGSGWLVMVTHSRKGWFNSSQTKKMSYQIQSPLLVMLSSNRDAI